MVRLRSYLRPRSFGLTCLYRNAVIIGPADTPFEDGTFKLVMHFDENYPNKPPQVKFISRMVSRSPKVLLSLDANLN